MSRVLSLRLKDEQMERLSRVARRLGHTPSRTAAILLEEALRVDEFSYVEFRNSAIGRQAYVRGSRVTIWMLEWIARAYDHDPVRVAEHLNWPVFKVQGGLEYAKAFPEEVNEAIAEHEAADFASLKRMLPQAELFVVTGRDLTSRCYKMCQSRCRAMLHLLLDEHISPTVAKQLRMRNPTIAITNIQEWHGGAYLGEDDDKLIEAAHAERLTLVTYDQQTIKPMLRIWGVESVDHSGVIFVASNTIAARDIGGLVRALANLWDNYHDYDWLNRMTYLERA